MQAIKNIQAQLLSYAYQAANGMSHLAREYIQHRDLALRNLLLTRDHIVKVSDFGLSKRCPETFQKPLFTSKDNVPLYWMAPEYLSEGRYTDKSDV